MFRQKFESMVRWFQGRAKTLDHLPEYLSVLPLNALMALLRLQKVFQNASCRKLPAHYFRRREPLGVSANKQTIAEARRLCATIQLELKARTFDYAKRFPDSDRIKQRGIETPEKVQSMSVTELPAIEVEVVDPAVVVSSAGRGKHRQGRPPIPPGRTVARGFATRRSEESGIDSSHLVPVLRSTQTRASCSMRTASRCTFRARSRVNDVIAITFPSGW